MLKISCTCIQGPRSKLKIGKKCVWWSNPNLSLSHMVSFQNLLPPPPPLSSLLSHTWFWLSLLHFLAHRLGCPFSWSSKGDGGLLLWSSQGDCSWFYLKLLITIFFCASGGLHQGVLFLLLLHCTCTYSC